MIDSVGSITGVRQDHDDHERLTAALRPGGLRAAAQPVVSLRGARIGIEIIARPRDGTPPDHLFAIAREQGGEPALSRVMLRLIEANLQACGSLPVAVNIDPALIGVLSPELRRLARALPGGLSLELPEMLPIESPELIARAARAIGVRLMVDDVGAGLPRRAAEIARLQPAAVKIDREAIRGAVRDRRTAAIFAAHVEIALRVAPAVIVEGVEGRPELRLLRSVAAGRSTIYAQGYHFGRPALLPNVLAGR